MTRIVLAVMCVVLLVSSSFAGASSCPGTGAKAPKAAQRMNNQKARIKQGVKSGELTKEEAKSLREGQKETKEMMKTATEDGTVTKEERGEIKQKIQEESKEIAEAKHNEERETIKKEVMEDSKEMATEGAESMKKNMEMKMPGK